MIISHIKKFIFIHNYKVAGTSITKALAPFDNRKFEISSFSDKIKFRTGFYPKIFSDEFTDHIKASELKEKIPLKIFNEYFKFGFVRNPWDWQASLYIYMLRTENHHQHELIKSMKDFDEYIDWRVHKDLHLQKDFFYNGEQCLINFIGRMETLNEDFEKVCNMLGISVNLPYLNTSREDHSFLQYYSQESLQMVYEAFIEDIELFGYLKPQL